LKTEPLGDIIVERSSGNVFADVGLEDADQLLARADIIIAIQREIERRGLTKKQSADLIGLTQQDISNIIRAEIDPVSQARLMEAVRLLDLDVDMITARTRPLQAPGSSGVCRRSEMEPREG
jgi:predicted XRE-type DNA-binding protein